MVGVGRADRDPAPSHDVLLDAGAPTRPTGPVRGTARGTEPSWARVLVNTVKLPALRRLRAAGPRRRRASGSRPWHARPRWRFAALVLALAGAAVMVLWLAGGLTGSSSRATRVPAAHAGPKSYGRGTVPDGRGTGPGGRLDCRSGERQRGHRVLFRHVRGAAGTGRRRGPGCRCGRRPPARPAPTCW